MTKKIIMLILLGIGFSSSAFANDNVGIHGMSANYYSRINHEIGVLIDGNIGIEAQPGNSFHPNPKDWIGVYKVGDSNAWGNVKLWAWATDFKELGNMGKNTYYFKNPKLPNGKYEVRYFLNNSFKVYRRTMAFTIKKDGEAQAKISFAQQRDLGLIFATTTSGKGNKDWVGLYKVGASNAWGNVLSWAWIDHAGEPGFEKSIDLNNVPSGEYELRLFYHNSYKVEARKRVIIDMGEAQPSIDAWQRDGGLVFEATTSGKGNKDWVGLYKVGASNAWGNVQAWAWLDSKPGPFGKGFRVEDLPAGEYEIRLFYHNSYKVEARKRIVIKWVH